MLLDGYCLLTQSQKSRPITPIIVKDGTSPLFTLLRRSTNGSLNTPIVDRVDLCKRKGFLIRYCHFRVDLLTSHSSCSSFP